MYKSIFIPLSSNGDQAPVLAFGAAMADALDAQVEYVFSSKSMTLIQEEQSEQVAAMYKKEGYVASQKLIVELYQHQFKTRAKQVSEWFSYVKRS